MIHTTQPYFVCANVALLRSALFSAARYQPRYATSSRVIASLCARHIQYYGPALSQYDQDVLFALHYVVDQLPSVVIATQPQSILLSQLFAILGKQHYGRTDYHLVQAAIKRLASAYCCMHNRRHAFCGVLLTTLQLTHVGKRVVVKFNPIYKQFCQTTAHVMLNLSQRVHLSGKLVRWLHGFWSSYRVIPIVSLDNLHLYSGSQEKHRGNFKKRLLVALDQLSHIGFIEPYWWVSRRGVVLAQRKFDPAISQLDPERSPRNKKITS